MTRTTQRFVWRYSLRSLLLAMACLGPLLGYVSSTYRLVQLRKQAWARFDDGDHSLFAGQLLPADPPVQISLLRELLGDVACETLIYAPDRDLDGEQLKEAQTLFQEARIWAWPDGRPLPDSVQVLPCDRAVGDHRR